MAKITEPRTALLFDINSNHSVNGNAEQNNACECVVAKALKDKYPTTLLEVAVLSSVTRLRWTGGREDIYATPKNLKNALRAFDNTGYWTLPEGEYRLNPVPPSQLRKTQRDRATKRRENGDTHMDTVYALNGGKTPRRINPRVINLVALRNTPGA